MKQIIASLFLDILYYTIANIICGNFWNFEVNFIIIAARVRKLRIFFIKCSKTSTFKINAICFAASFNSLSRSLFDAYGHYAFVEEIRGLDRPKTVKTHLFDNKIITNVRTH